MLASPNINQPRIPAKTNDPATIVSPKTDCQIFAQADSIFLGSPPALRKPYPARIMLKKAKSPAPKIISFNRLLAKFINPWSSIRLPYLLTPGGSLMVPKKFIAVTQTPVLKIVLRSCIPVTYAISWIIQ